MSIVQPSDFEGKYTLANTSEAYIDALIQLAIDEYEPTMLTDLLGAELYADFIAGLAQDPVLPKWTALQAKVFKSILCYVYYMYMRDNATSTTGNGETNAKTANAEQTTPIDKMMDRWNEGVKGNYATVKFVNDTPDDYPHIPTHYPWTWAWLAWGYQQCEQDSVFEFKNRWL